MKINFSKIISKKCINNFALSLLFLYGILLSGQASASDGNAIGVLAVIIWYIFLIGEGILLLTTGLVVYILGKNNKAGQFQYFILILAGSACGAAAFFWLKAGFSYTWPFVLGMCSCLSLIVWLLTRKVKL